MGRMFNTHQFENPSGVDRPSGFERFLNSCNDAPQPNDVVAGMKEEIVVETEYSKSRLFKNVFKEEFGERLFRNCFNEVSWDSTGNPLRKSQWAVRPPCSCPYTYGGKTWYPSKWHEAFEETCQVAEQVLGLQGYFNAVVANLYQGRGSALGLHADDESLFHSDREFTIASLSLGATKDFTIKETYGCHSLALELEHGDLLTMEGAFQSEFMHSVGGGDDGFRVNLTFRRITQHRCTQVVDRFSWDPVA